MVFGVFWRIRGPDFPSNAAPVPKVSLRKSFQRVGSVRDGSLSLITEYGSVRIPLDRITPESNTKLGIYSYVVSSEVMAARIRELEDLVTRLREENAALRRPVSPGPFSRLPEFQGIPGGVPLL